MRFEKLNHDIIKLLKEKGYNILSSNNKLTDENVIWFPERVEDVCEFLFGMDGTPFNEPNILVLDDALKNINDIELVGEVFM